MQNLDVVSWDSNLELHLYHGCHCLSISSRDQGTLWLEGKDNKNQNMNWFHPLKSCQNKGWEISVW